MRCVAIFLLLAGAISFSRTSQAGGGPLLIDYPVTYDNSGIWNRSDQQLLMNATILTVVGGSFLLGDQDKLGDTFWRSMDSMALSAVVAQGGKLVFQRKRPSQTDDPSEFFKGTQYESFPSGEVSAIAGAVTPFVVQYGREHPAVYALEVLPLYDAIARVKVHGHWQSDVVAGWAVGGLAGWYAHERDSPLLLQVMPHGIFVGLKKSF